MIRLAMSNSCVFPLGTEQAFRLSAEAGFDGLEIMVTQDRSTQNAETLLALAERYEQPVLSVHAPVLPFTGFVWGREPRGKLERSAELAVATGAKVVVVHPPFRWQFRYARTFVQIVREVSEQYGVELAVENMFPWRVKGRGIQAYLPSDDPTAMDVDAMTLDFSHAALAGLDSGELAARMGDRLRHVHLCDGTVALGEGRFDEHLVPGRGTQPVAKVLEQLAGRDWDGVVAAEVATRRAAHGESRLDLLRETVRFTRAHLDAGVRSARAARAARRPSRPQASQPAPEDADRLGRLSSADA